MTMLLGVTMPNNVTRLGRIGVSIREAREAQKLTQTELAERAAISRLSVVRIEQGSHVNTDTLVKAISALGLEIKLIEGEE